MTDEIDARGGVSALLPCPFCGGPGETVHDTSSDYDKHWSWSAQCATWREKRVCGSDINFKTEAEAIAAWNRRTDPTTTTRLRDAAQRARELLQATVLDRVPLHREVRDFLRELSEEKT